MSRLFTLLLIFISAQLFCQSGGISVSPNGSPPAASAGLDVNFTNKGFLMPRLTQSQRDSIAVPDFGLLILNTTTNCLNIWLGTSWQKFCSTCDFDNPVAGNNGPVCSGDSLYLTATNVAGGSYQWSGPNGFSSTLQNPAIPNAAPAASGTYSVVVTLNGCSSQPQSTIATINSVAAPTATNNGPLCAGQNLVLNPSTIAGATYSWSGPDGFTSNTQNVTLSNVTTINSGTYNVVATVNGCISDTGSTTAVIYSSSPAQPGAISGATANLGGATGITYSITSVDFATSYAWTVPAGATITAGQGSTSITVSFSCSADGNIGVTANNPCGTSPQQNVYVSTDIYTPGPDGINGPSSLTTTGQMAGIIYSVPPVPYAASYNWTVPIGAVIESGQGTDSIVVNCPTGSNTSGTISISQTSTCGTSSQTSLNVNTTFAVPGAISGNTVFSIGASSNYSISAVDNATSYTWTTSLGTITSGQGTTAVSVNWDTAGIGSLSVVENSACGSSAAQTEAIYINTEVFFYTGSAQTFTVPVGINSINIQCWGAQGQGGGLGGYATGNLNVSAGQQLGVYVGGQSGYNGGGIGNSGNGGGASDVRQGGSTLNNRVIVAGGGGGGYADGGGAGGGTSGGPSPYSNNGNYAQGGTQSAGGVWGGSFGIGANSDNNYGGSGGGGGWYGGGSNNTAQGAPVTNSAGGGGSGYIGGVSSASMQTGVQSGNGQIIITW